MCKMIDDTCICASSELRDHCFKKAEQARDLHFSPFITIINFYYRKLIDQLLMVRPVANGLIQHLSVLIVK